MKPFLHAKITAKKHGGKMEDYLDIHDFIDHTKEIVPDMRHRALLHSAFGCFMVEKIFGHVRLNSDGKEYSPRDIAEEHIIQDLGFIPTVQDYLQHLELKDWMTGTQKKNTYVHSKQED